MIDDKDYLDFLKVQLPKLRKEKIPILSRTFSPRNDTLRHVLRIMENEPAGLIMEFGVWNGGTINKIARKFKKNTVYGFDSFSGFPDDGRSDWKQDFSLGSNLPNVESNVQLIKGYFEETLPAFADSNRSNTISFLHIDCDIYSSTKTIFQECSEIIKPGCVIVFDELLHYRRFPQNEMLAFYEFIQETGMGFKWLGTRGKVMDIETFLSKSESYGPMKSWRKNGYFQEAALKIV